MTSTRLNQLEAEFNRLVESNPRQAAEYAYALAMIHKHGGDTTGAVRFGHSAIGLLGKCRMETEDDFVSINSEIGGVPMPDYFHEGVIKANLSLQTAA